MLSIINEHNYKLSSFRADFKKVFILASEKLTSQKHEQSLSIMFCTEEEIIILNKKYRQLEKKSDVLAFPPDRSFTPSYLGDVVVCYPVAVAQAIEYGHSLRRELAFLSLHGLLHLLGYDHVKLEDEKVMFALQEEILSSLGIKRRIRLPVRNRSKY